MRKKDTSSSMRSGNCIKDLLPCQTVQPCVTAKDNQLFIDAVLYRYRAGCYATVSNCGTCLSSRIEAARTRNKSRCRASATPYLPTVATIHSTASAWLPRRAGPTWDVASPNHPASAARSRMARGGTQLNICWA